MENKKLIEFEDFNQQDSSKSWISLTGFRSLLVLRALLDAPKTSADLTSLLKTNKVTAKSLSIDTIRLTIKTLKDVGCKIQRPSKRNQYKYVLTDHPFKLNLTDDDIDILAIAGEKFAQNASWKEVLVLNNFFKKILSISVNNEMKLKANDEISLLKVDLNILKELINPETKGKKVNINYNSRKNGNETLDVIPYDVVFSNKKLYLRCYIFKYEKSSILNIENISKINSIDLNQSFEAKDSYEVIFEITNSDFEINPNEQELEKIGNKRIIKAEVKNEFLFVQRILELGDDVKIISPDEFKDKIKNKLIEIRKVYLDT